MTEQVNTHTNTLSQYPLAFSTLFLVPCHRSREKQGVYSLSKISRNCSALPNLCPVPEGGSVRSWVQFSSVTQLCPSLCDLWTAASQASLSITNSWSLLKLMSVKSVMPSNHLILCCPLLLLSIFPWEILKSKANHFSILALRTP